MLRAGTSQHSVPLSENVFILYQSSFLASILHRRRSQVVWTCAWRHNKSGLETIHHPATSPSRSDTQHLGLMPHSTLPEPPTEVSITNAKASLTSSQKELEELTQKIERAEAALQQIVADSRCAINEMLEERSVLEEQVQHTRAYISPIRRLPTDLLREVFMKNFEDYPCCAWVLAAVCTMWRRLALCTPRLWTKVSLIASKYGRWWLSQGFPCRFAL